MTQPWTDMIRIGREAQLALAADAEAPLQLLVLHAATVIPELQQQLAAARLALTAVTTLADRFDPHIGQQIRFAAKHGQLQHELRCEDCSVGDHYHCAHGQPSYPRCCCPERMDLNQ